MTNSTSKNTITTTTNFMRNILSKLLVGLLFVLGTVGAKAQTMTNYAGANFVASTGTFTPQVGGTSVPALLVDDAASGPLPIGFNFYYMGKAYTQVRAGSDGYLSLYTSGTGSSITNNLATGTTVERPVIAPFWDDMDGRGTGAAATYLTTGTIGSRVFTFEWLNWVRTGGTTPVMSFQVKLYESTGRIQFIYRSDAGALSGASASIGLCAVATGAGNFVSLSDATAAPTTSTATETTTISTKPATDQVYTFTPPQAAVADPTTLTFSTVTLTTMTLNWVDNSTNETNFNIFRSLDGINYTYVTTITSTTTAATGGPYNYAATGLNPNTTYFWQVVANSEGVPSNPLAGSQATTSCSIAAGTYTIGATGTYTSVTNALTALVANGITGAVVLELQTDYAPEGAITFPLVPCASATNTITIRPAAGVAAPIVLTSAAASPTFNINGGQYYIIDGRNGGTGTNKFITIANSSTTGQALQFINEGANNIVRYCTIQGVNTSTTSGVVVFSTTTGANGNDNNTIDNCDIRDGATTPNNGIYSSGTTTTAAQNNSGNTISNCNIFNFFAAALADNGILISSGNTDWTITGNSLYQTATRTYTASGNHIGINIANSSGNNFIVTNNFIGGGAASAGGTAWTFAGAFTNRFRAISLSVGSTTASSVQGNTIANFVHTSNSSSTTAGGPWVGIYLTAGNANIGNTAANTIGSGTGTGSINLTVITNSGARSSGIYCDATSTVSNISNNIIGSISGAASTISQGFSGIVTTSGTTLTINNNTIGSTVTANSINMNSGATSTTAQITYGIHNTSSATIAITNNTIANINNNYLPSSASTSNIMTGILSTSGINTITGNTVRNLSTAANATGTTSASSVIGISLTSTTAGTTVGQNTVHTLSNTHATAATNIIGIYYNGATTGTNLIARNFVHSLALSTSSTSGVMTGMHFAGGLHTIQNNMVRLGIDAAGANITGNYAITGINDLVGTAGYSIIHNSVYIGGTGVIAGTNNTAAFNTSTTINARTFRNNIFTNDRANGAGTGFHLAAIYAGTLPNPAGLTLSHNVYYSSTTANCIRNSTTNYTVGGWQSASSQDAGSYQAPVLSQISFVNATGNSGAVDLHITGTTVIEASGNATTTATDDFDGQTRASLSPVDIGADAGNFTALDLIAPAISYTAIPSTACFTNRTLSTTITDANGINVTAGTTPRLYFKKSGDLNTYAGNTSADNGWKYVETADVTSPFSFTTNYALLQTAVAPGDVIQYFVVAQDNAGTPNVGINSGIFAATPTSVALTLAAFPLTGTINSYNIASALPVSVTVGASGTYHSLTESGAFGLFADINSKYLSANTTVTILDPTITESGAIALNQINYGCSGGPYTLTIVPNTAVTTVLSGSFAGPLIDLNGADNVIFDGSNSGGSSKDMTISNTSTSGSAIRFINDATNNIVKNTILLGVNSSSTSGTVVFSTTTGSSGNSNNTINNCDIRDGATVPVNAVYSSGSAGGPNANNTISGCRIFNFTGSGVLVTSTGAGNGWTINPTSFYQTANRTTAINVISIQGGNGHSILNNSIGGSASDRSGNPFATTGTFTAINLAVGTTTATSVQGNTISNLNVSGGSFQTWQGINISAGNVNVGTVTGNTIGGGAAVYDTIRINYDSRAIYNTGAGVVDIQNNTIGNIAYYRNAGDELRGIRVTAGTNTIKNNTVRDLKSNATASTSFFLSGIDMLAATAGNLVEGNQVYNLTQTNGSAGSIFNVGMFIGGLTSGEVKKNKIYGIDATASSLLYGIYALSGSATYSNNMISINPAGVSNNHFIGGVRDDGTGVNNWYFNSVSVAGTSGAGTNNTYAFFRSGTATVDIKGNIFSNTRTGSTGYHVAIANTNAAATGWAAGASNYNDLYASTVGQWLGSVLANNRTTLPDWQASQGAGTPGSGGDANSYNISVPFVNIATGDLHIPAATATPIESGAVAVGGIVVDYDNQVRPGGGGTSNGGGTAPDMGADEFDGTPATPMIYVSSTTTQNIANVGVGSVNKHVIGLQIVTSGSLSPLTATSITIGTTGTTNLADITNAKLWYTGTSSTFATTTQFGSTVGTPTASFNITGSQVLQQGTNYFWLTYDIPCSATVGNAVDGECTSFNIGSVQSPTPTAPAGNLTIVAGTGISGTKTVGTGGFYADLTAAAADINANGLSGAVTLDILNSITEPGAVVFNALNYVCGGPFTLTIKPASTVTATISGSVASGALIKFNGTDNVIIDGSNNGTSSRDLTFSNTSTTSPAVIWVASTGLAAGSENITIKNCNINTGSNAATSYGIAIAGATLGSGGADNDNVTIQNNNITQVYHGIWANGSASVSAGGLDVLNINNNIIGPVASGANNIGFSGINLGNAISPSVASNTVQNIAATVASASGITLANTTSPTVTLNTVQNLASTSTSATGILTASTVTNAVITQNTIQTLTATAGGFMGMSIAGASGGSFNVSQNIISAINGTVGSSSSVIGIHITAASPVTLNRNRVSGVTNNNTGTWGAFGINLAGGDGHILTNNFVSNISQNMTGGGAFSTSFGVFGIRVASGINHQVYHNSVNLYGLLSGTATSSLLTAAFAITSTTLTGCDVRNNIFANNITGGTTSIAHVSVFLPSGGTTAMNLTWNNNAYYTGTTAGVHGVAQGGISYISPVTTAGSGLYTVADFNSAATTPVTNLRNYTSALLVANTNNDNASVALNSTVPFVSNTDLHIPAAYASQLESGGAVTSVVLDIDNDVRPGPAGSTNGGATAPDMGADEFDGVPATPMIYVSSTTTQNTSNVGNGTTNNHVIGIQIVTSGTLSPLSATSFTLNTNGSTAPLTDITNAKLWYTGNSSTFATGTQFGATDPAPNGVFIITGTQTLVQGTNYFWLTYDVPCTSVLGNVIDAECNSLTVTIPRTPTVQAPAGSRTIIAGGLSGTVTIGAAGTYPTITGTGGLFAAINTNGLSGNLTANIIDASVTETGAIALNQITFGCLVGPYGVTIKPDAGVTTNLTGSVATSLIKLNGADNVTIDGSNNGSSSRNMTLTNTGTGAIVWIGTDATAGATNNTLKNFNMVGPGTFTGQGIISGSGTTFGSAAESGRANSNNTIQNLTAKGMQNAIFAIGDATTPDQNWLITQNEFGSAVVAEKLSFRGIALQNAQNFTISRNRIFGVSSSTLTSSTMSGIQVGSTLNGGTIERNEISDIKQNNTGGWGSNGIFLTSSSTAANVNVNNNVIYDVASFGFDDITAADNGYGIMVNSGGGYNIRFNSIRMTTDQTDITGRTAAINISSGITTAASLDIRDNIFANTQTVGNRYAVISAAANTVFASINYNDYYSAGVVGYNGTVEYANLAAWQTASAQDANSVAVDPLYTSTTNLNLLAGSPLIGAGITITGVVNDYTNSTRNNPPSIGAFEDKVVFSAKIFLQGAYAGAGLHRANTANWTTATNAGALSHPYGAAPYSYTGTETVPSGFFANTGATTDPMDWVLLELRDATTPTTVIARRAAIIREDGQIVDLDGTSPVSFRGINSGTHFVVIRHRNHLGVRSGTTQLIDGNATTPTTYDFTTAQSQALQDGTITTNAAMAQVGTGVFGLWAGNVNQDIYVRATASAIPAIPSDAAAILVILGGIPTATGGYSPGDVNMDGRTRATASAIPAIPSDAAFILSTPLSGVPTATRREHKVIN